MIFYIFNVNFSLFYVLNKPLEKKEIDCCIYFLFRNLCFENISLFRHFQENVFIWRASLEFGFILEQKNDAYCSLKYVSILLSVAKRKAFFSSSITLTIVTMYPFESTYETFQWQCLAYYFRNSYGKQKLKNRHMFKKYETM